MEKEKPAMGCRTETVKKKREREQHTRIERRGTEKQKKKLQQHGKERGPGEGQGGTRTQKGGNEGPGLTATLALGAAGRICQFRRFFLLLSSLPLL